MKSIIEFINEKQNFIVKGHTVKQNIYDVYYIDDYEGYDVLLKTKEDIDIFVNKAIDNFEKIVGKKADKSMVNTGLKVMKGAYDRGEKVYISFPRERNYPHGCGFMRFNSDKKYKKIGSITLNQFTPEYFKKMGWSK